MKIINALTKMLMSLRPDGRNSWLAIDGIEKVTAQAEHISRLDSKYFDPVSKSDLALAKGLITIASSYGFRYNGNLSSGMFHFIREDDDLTEYLHVNIETWPRGAVMYLRAHSDAFGGMKSEDFGLYYPTSANWEDSITPKAQVAEKIIELLERAEEIRDMNDLRMDGHAM